MSDLEVAELLGVDSRRYEEDVEAGLPGGAGKRRAMQAGRDILCAA
jgi:hypothetical protein